MQRNVGFEFEVGSYPAYRLGRAMTAEQLNGETALTSADEDPLAKGDVLGRGTGFEMQVDQGRDDFHLEFVTPGNGFPETKSGRAALKVALRGMEAMGNEVTSKERAATARFRYPEGLETPVVRTDEISGGIGTLPETLIEVSGGQMHAEPQTTAGVRLDQIPTLMKSLGFTPGESMQSRQSRATQVHALSGKSGEIEKPHYANSEASARGAIGRFRNQVPVQPGFGSKGLVGLTALIYTYLNQGTREVLYYPKALFPLLGISNFAVMFAHLHDDDKAPFLEDSQRFVDINLDAAGMVGTGAAAFFSGGFADQLTNMSPEDSQQVALALGEITRGDWLGGIPLGTDQLTSSVSGQPALESMGRFDRGEYVGQTHRFGKTTTTWAPVLELRRMGSNVGINNWTDLGLDVFDFLWKLNDLKTGTFEQRRYNAAHQKP
ncbi:MAG: hypothetical protein ACRERD_33960 [Candidatus Binatia bacterium]